MTTAAKTLPASLNLADDAAFLRGIEYADAATIENVIRAIREMKEPIRYTNQDFDRKLTMQGVINVLRKIGNTPIDYSR